MRGDGDGLGTAGGIFPVVVCHERPVHMVLPVAVGVGGVVVAFGLFKNEHEVAEDTGGVGAVDLVNKEQVSWGFPVGGVLPQGGVCPGAGTGGGVAAG